MFYPVDKKQYDWYFPAWILADPIARSVVESHVLEGVFLGPFLVGLLIKGFPWIQQIPYPHSSATNFSTRDELDAITISKSCGWVHESDFIW